MVGSAGQVSGHPARSVVGLRSPKAPNIRRRVFLRLLPSRLRDHAVMFLLRAASPLFSPARSLRTKLKRELMKKYRLRKQYFAILYSGAFDHAYYRTMYADACVGVSDLIWHFLMSG